LGGITRNSVIKLAQSWNIAVEERPISISEVIEASQNGTLRESFATGTAAVISPVGERVYNDAPYPLNGGETGPLSIRLFKELQAIQYGRAADPFGWRVKVG
jgi:branched-chain amino acid aminotransferase